MRPSQRWISGLLTAGLLLAPGCGHAGGEGGRGTVSVLYAASLQHLMGQYLSPAFDASTGYRVAALPGGSQALANEIKGKLQAADVFISAAPSVNASLMGAANGAFVSWYVTFAAAPLVIGYSPSSRFAGALRAGPWYAAMEEPGFRLGRTDPQLDPKGALTIQFVQAAASYYGQSDLVAKVLGAAENPAQIFPEQDLVGRLQAGQLDAGFFYANEAKDAGIPTIPTPTALRMGATFTVTIPAGAPDPAGAAAFVRYLLGASGAAELQREGLTVLPATVSGDAAAVPPGVAALLHGSAAAAGAG